MSPKRYVPDSEKIPETRLNMHPLTSKSRMYVSRKGNFTKNNVEGLSFDDYVKTFSHGNVESRNRPDFALSEFAQTLLASVALFKQLVSCKLLGPGVEWLIQQVDEHADSLNILNTYGPNGMNRNLTSMKAAVEDVMAWLAEMARNKKAKALVMALFKASEASRHAAQQLSEFMSAAEDPLNYAQRIGRPRDQPCPEKLEAWKQKKAVGASREAMTAWFAASMSTKASKIKNQETVDDNAEFDFSQMEVEKPAHVPEDETASSSSTEEEEEPVRKSKKKDDKKKPQRKKGKAARSDNEDTDDKELVEDKRKKTKAPTTTALKTDDDAEHDAQQNGKVDKEDDEKKQPRSKGKQSKARSSRDVEPEEVPTPKMPKKKQDDDDGDGDELPMPQKKAKKKF